MKTRGLRIVNLGVGCLLLGCALCAQIPPRSDFNTNNGSFDELALRFKVKQLDEFIRRFNYETDYTGKRIERPAFDSLPVDTAWKRKNLMTLLNLEKFQKSDHRLDSLSTAFIEYLIRETPQLHYEDTTWTAEAFATVRYRQQEYPIQLYLRTEQRKGIYYKWILKDVLSPLFAALWPKSNANIFLMPNLHGISFLSLPSFLNENSESVRHLHGKGYELQRLTLFDFLYATRQLEMRAISRVVYHFRLPRYRFRVERFEHRDSYNQGWLINEIRPI